MDLEIDANIYVVLTNNVKDGFNSFFKSKFKIFV